MNVQLLMTGNELMSGDIVDSNSAMIASQLKDIGIEIKRKVTVSDDIELLVAEIQNISQKTDILIINGGLGPTTDDLTAEALARVTGTSLVQHKQALAHLTAWCDKKSLTLNHPNLKQALLPQGCDIIANATGSAVGIKLTYNQCVIYCTPGVPSELKIMSQNEILPELKAKIPNNALVDITRFQVFGYGESSLQKLIQDNCPNWPVELEIGFRASMPLLELKITSRTQQALKLKIEWLKTLKNILGTHIVNQVEKKPLSLAHILINQLIAENKTVTTAESCTGGMIASAITKVAGASQAFHAGFVSYSNEIKESVLAVPNQIIVKYGAVSEQTVKAMANGALAKSNADYAIAVSGIAGPDGGSTEKPVGLVCLAWGSRENIKTVSLYIPTSRFHFQQSVTAIGLDLLRRELLGDSNIPKYFIDKKAAD